MPQYKSGNIWTEYGKPNSTILVTTCGVILNGKLVMGAGAALDAKLREPELPALFGSLIKRYGSMDNNIGNYALLYDTDRKINAFQTKYHYKHDSSVDLISMAAKQLAFIAELTPNKTFNLTFPGIGFGRLNPESVKPLLAGLPDNVIIWSK
ncbi:MAG: hypothetical protein CMC55_08595 [Flavobacteriaceae bacterium]|nr:hypothetical protein [Flavobacteriaceae bacterium]|tara:strand:+ start:175 stop:630 length:456 start_codon:yes stop_codon:yes gene_type:complete